jgi:hypothetical protein
MSTPAGWYPDPQAEGQQRYWDGNVWTEHQAPVAQTQQPSQPNHPAWSAPRQSIAYGEAAPVAAKQKKPFWRRTWVVVTAGILVAFIAISAASGSGDTSNTAAKDTPSVKAQQNKTSDTTVEAQSTPNVTPAADPSPTKKAEPTKKPKPAPSYTVSQEQAIGSAKDYLDFSAFSKAGLIKQLSSKYGDGFSNADATFAVNHITVNWNEQAVRSAKDYLSMSHFSRAGLIQQLHSKYGDGYTLAQATYAANHVGL